MDPLQCLTITLSRLTRRRWSRTQAMVAVCVIVVALAIITIEWLGDWPDATRAEHGRRGPLRQ